MTDRPLRLILAEAVRRLERAEVPSPARDARKLLYGVLETSVLPDPAQPLAPGAVARFDAMIAQRETRVPVSRILGHRAFHGHEFLISNDVLDPRPDTEHLVDAGLESPFDRVLDLGTGSGCILLSLLGERPAASGVGVDLSEPALTVARANARALGIDPARVAFAVSDWFGAVEGAFELIVSNPPYIPAADLAGLQPEVRDHEPRIALTDGGDGLGAYRAIAAGVMDHLAPGGRLIVEIGPDQATPVAALFQQAGLQEISLRQDHDGRDRVLIGQRKGNNSA